MEPRAPRQTGKSVLYNTQRLSVSPNVKTGRLNGAVMSLMAAELIADAFSYRKPERERDGRWTGGKKERNLILKIYGMIPLMYLTLDRGPT